MGQLDFLFATTVQPLMSIRLLYGFRAFQLLHMIRNEKLW